MSCDDLTGPAAQLYQRDVSVRVVGFFQYLRHKLKRVVLPTTSMHAFGLDDGPVISFLIPISFPLWVTSAERYWVILPSAERA